MTTISMAILDHAELLQLALAASKQGDSSTALSYLKEAVSRADAPATAHFLLGAEYAHVRMYEHALSEMETAMTVDPSFAMARFQFGLLLLTSGHASKAADVLQPLDNLGSQAALACFGNGLRHLIRDEFAAAMECLTRGIELNTENQALNIEMQKIIAQVKSFTEDVSPQKSPLSLAENSDHHHFLISSYTNHRMH